MGFQAKEPFFAFLQHTAAGVTLDQVAPAENYILDERVSDARGNEFLAFNGFLSAVYDRDSWFRQHVCYAKARVALPAVSETFTAINSDNWQNWSPDWDVVRIETLSGLNDRALRRGSHLVEAEVAALIRAVLDARETGVAPEPFAQAALAKWLQLVNRGSDHRPAFVTPFAEVEDILKQPDWANRLRDALGLGHVRAWGGSPTTVVLMQYNLERVHNARIGRPAWCASPTVLDDVPGQMPNPCFFPAPKAASVDGYGFTVDLATSGATYRTEFLHGQVGYTLADIRRLGTVTSDVQPSRIADARREHQQLMGPDLRYLSDLPSRP